MLEKTVKMAMMVPKDSKEKQETLVMQEIMERLERRVPKESREKKVNRVQLVQLERPETMDK